MNAAPGHSPREVQARQKFKVESELVGLGGGGVGAGALLLALFLRGRLAGIGVLPESNSGGAEDQGHTEHQAHDLLHLVISPCDVSAF
jgi:hypothetical protein